MSWLDLEQFFDAEYETLYPAALDPARTEREVKACVGILGLREGMRVLDVCCGTGRHSIALQRRGLRVTGVDLAPALLARAVDRASRVGSFPAWVRGDARMLPLRDGAFDAAVCLFNSIGYGTDAESLAMLREMRRCAKAVLIDIVHRDEHARTWKQGGVYEWGEFEGFRILADWDMDPVAGVARATFRIVRAGKPEVRKELKHRLWSATEMVELLRKAGFSRIDCYGDYDRRKFDVDSPILLAHAR